MAGAAERDISDHVGDDGTIPLQSVDALPSGGDVKVKCHEFGGDAAGRNLKITAIQIGSIG